MAAGVHAIRIDTHVHLTRWWPEIERTGYRVDLDYTVRGLIAELDRSRIDAAIVIQTFHAPSEEESLAEGRQHLEEGRGRLLPVATVDPTKGEESVAQTIDRWSKEKVLHGIKLYPGYLPFYPGDPRLAPVLEFASKRKLPVLVHLGDTLQGRGLLKFARPIEVDEVAGRYRDVRFVLCHLGNPWIDEAVEVLYKNPNVYADTSGLLLPPSSKYLRPSLQYIRDTIQHAIVTSGAPERFLFGSDWPISEIGLAADLVESLPLLPGDNAAVLGQNAARLFGLQFAEPPRLDLPPPGDAPEGGRRA